MAVKIDRRLMVGSPARRGPYHDGAMLRPVGGAAHQWLTIGLVPADAEFARQHTHQHLRHILQAHSAMSAKRGGAEWQSQGVQAQRRQDFPGDLSHQRTD
jgi:hypothetical protein